MSANQLIAKISVQIVNPLIGLFIVIALVVFIWGVVEFIAGAENEEKREKGKQHIIWGVIGLFIMVAVAGILQIIGSFWDNLGK